MDLMGKVVWESGHRSRESWLCIEGKDQKLGQHSLVLLSFKIVSSLADLYWIIFSGFGRRAFRSYIYCQEIIEQLLCSKHSAGLYGRFYILGRHRSKLMSPIVTDVLGERIR